MEDMLGHLGTTGFPSSFAVDAVVWRGALDVSVIIG